MAGFDTRMIDRDWALKATAAEGSLRAIGAVTTTSVRAAQWAQHAAPLAAAAMGRLMTAAVLLGADLKNPNESLHLEVNGGGPLRRVIAEAHGGGLVRGRVDRPDVSLPLNAVGKLAVGQAVGHDGRLSVTTRTADGGSYTSVSALVSGEIGEDVAHHLLQAVQRLSAVAVGVLVGTDGLTLAAGGLLVEALPGCPPALLDGVEKRFSGIARLSHLLAEGTAIEELMERVLPEPLRWLGRSPVRFGCLCNREQSRNLLEALSVDERRRMQSEGGAEVVCHYCRTAYRFSAGDLGRSLDVAIDPTGP